MCGGTIDCAGADAADAGLSPRVRGNPPERFLGCVRAGSIPACAGEPEDSGGYVGDVRVYPRVCGGTRRAVEEAEGHPGLSPRVRGNLG